MPLSRQPGRERPREPRRAHGRRSRRRRRGARRPATPCRRRRRGRRVAGARCARRIRREAGRGDFSRVSSSRIAPWGGERPTGSSSSTGSRTTSPPKRTMRAGTRSSKPLSRAGAGDDHGGRRGLADVTGEHARVESVEAGAPPPPAGQEQSQRQSGHAPARIGDRHGHDHGNDGEHGCTSGNPAGVGGRQPEARAAREDIGVAQEQAPTRSVETRAGFRHAHGTTSPRSCSIRAGPIPGTSSSSSTERKAPCSAR